MRRRAFIEGASAASWAWPLAARGQQANPVVGFLNASVPIPAFVEEFRRGLAEHGFAEGRNVTIEYRWAEAQYDRLPDLAQDLVRRRVDAIVASGGTSAGIAAKAATSTIPIVVLIGGDPVEAGLAASLSHPAGNVTGVVQLVAAAE